MSRASRFARALTDPAVAWTLGGLYVALLLATVSDLGYARDEGFYVQAAKQYGRWFELLAKSPEAALAPKTVDRYWTANHEHPAFVKSLFWFSYKYLHVEWKLFAEQGTAFRFPGMALSGLAVGVTYLWGARTIGRLGGLVAALLFALMPRVYYHAHLDCFDMPVLAMWLVTAYAYWRSIEKGSIGWAIATGLLYGLLLNTKHNSWLLPGALVAHFLLARGGSIWRDLRRGRIAAPLSLFTMVSIGPAVFYLTWPWIWSDTGRRLADYVKFHVAHVYYNMEFLGQTYWEPPMPRGYAWLMTIGTVPAVTLLLFAIGLAFTVVRTRWLRDLKARLAKNEKQPMSSEEAPAEKPSHYESAPRLLWLLCIALSYLPWLSSSTPIFGGTKHWLTAYPFMCLFAAVGFVAVLERVRELLPASVARFRVAEIGTLASVVAAPLVITLSSHPWGLSAYTPAVGGAPGGATLGLNRGFWGYQTGAVQGFLNEASPKNARLFLHDTAHQSFGVMKADGRIRADLRGTLDIHNSSMALYHHEQHMSRVEYQIWLAYGTTRPAHIGTHDGVPVVWVYARPKTGDK